MTTTTLPQVSYRTKTVDGVSLFYREAGDAKNPTLVLLHGYPSSSFMYRDLILRLADRFHVVAPDYPGFGHSDAPATSDYEYTFDHLADTIDQFLESIGLDRYSLYVQDYGSPVGFRIAVKHPERVQSLIVQNANAYEEGLTPAWAAFRNYWQSRTPETEAAVASFFESATTQFFYKEGTRNPDGLSPDTWSLDQYFLNRPRNRAAQLELFYDYRSNLERYAQWHEYLRAHQLPTLIVWGKNDPFFGPEGAEAFKRDLPNAEIHLLDTGHFALEEDGEEIARLILAFLTEAAR